jgi:hypothetical protein
MHFCHHFKVEILEKNEQILNREKIATKISTPINGKVSF